MTLHRRLAALEEKARPKFDLAAAITEARHAQRAPRWTREEAQALAADPRQNALMRRIAQGCLQAGKVR